MKKLSMLLKKKNRGFTLVELIVVIAILAILVAIAVPQMLGFQERAREQADKQMGAQVRNAIALLIANEELTAGVAAFSVGDALALTDYADGELGVTGVELQDLLDELIADFDLVNTTGKLLSVTVDAGGSVDVELVAP